MACSCVCVGVLVLVLVCTLLRTSSTQSLSARSDINAAVAVVGFVVGFVGLWV